MRNQKAFTLVEIMICTAILFVIAISIFFLIGLHDKIFVYNPDMATLQNDGGTSLMVLSKGIKSAGFKIQRGQKIEAASDYYFSVLYDLNNDGVVRANEVITYIIDNGISGGGVLLCNSLASKSVRAFCDMDGNNIVSSDEYINFTRNLTLNSPPYSLYEYQLPLKVTPGTMYSLADADRKLIAENIEYALFRYYDEHNTPLPFVDDGSITDGYSGAVNRGSANDGMRDTDGKGNPIVVAPPYVLDANDRTLIRKVTMELMFRSPEKDNSYKSLQKKYPKNCIGTYRDGVVGSRLYYGGDGYRRKIFRETISLKASQ